MRSLKLPYKWISSILMSEGLHYIFCEINFNKIYHLKLFSDLQKALPDLKLCMNKSYFSSTKNKRIKLFENALHVFVCENLFFFFLEYNSFTGCHSCW